VDILDKGKGASVVLGVTSTDEAGDVVTENQFTFFIRGAGGFGGKKGEDRGAATALNTPPNRPADKVVVEKVSEDLAALYRLSGDWNPLHIDPAMSAMGGFDVPILHGLCTYGIAGKHIFNTYGDFKSIKTRFAKHVFPGETLETSMWKEGQRVVFVTKVVERNVIAISAACAELRDGEATEVVKSKAAPVAASGLKAEKIFAAINAGIQSLSETEKQKLIKKTKAVFGFTISSGDITKSWFVDLKTTGNVSNTEVKADMTVIVQDKDFEDLAAGKLQPQKAFMSGKIKIKGNMALSSKLEPVLKLAAPKGKL